MKLKGCVTWVNTMFRPKICLSAILEILEECFQLGSQLTSRGCVLLIFPSKVLKVFEEICCWRFRDDIWRFSFGCFSGDWTCPFAETPNSQPPSTRLSNPENPLSQMPLAGLKPHFHGQEAVVSEIEDTCGGAERAGQSLRLHEASSFKIAALESAHSSSLKVCFFNLQLPLQLQKVKNYVRCPWAKDM